MMLFEYMIGNTDLSIWALHNVRCRAEAGPHAARRAVRLRSLGLRARAVRDSRPAARPPQRASIGSIAARAGRAEEFEAAAAPFRAKRDEMLALIESMKDLDSSVAHRR